MLRGDCSLAFRRGSSHPVFYYGYWRPDTKYRIFEGGYEYSAEEIHKLAQVSLEQWPKGRYPRVARDPQKTVIVEISIQSIVSFGREPRAVMVDRRIQNIRNILRPLHEPHWGKNLPLLRQICFF